jgi:hypothetical protein
MRGPWIKRLYLGGVFKEVGEEARGVRDLGERKTVRLHRRFSRQHRCVICGYGMKDGGHRYEIIASLAEKWWSLGSQNRVVLEMPEKAARCKINDDKLRRERKA